MEHNLFLTISTAHAIGRKPFSAENHFQCCRALLLVLVVDEPAVVKGGRRSVTNAK